MPLSLPPGDLSSASGAVAVTQAVRANAAQLLPVQLLLIRLWLISLAVFVYLMLVSFLFAILGVAFFVEKVRCPGGPAELPHLLRRSILECYYECLTTRQGMLHSIHPLINCNFTSDVAQHTGDAAGFGRQTVCRPCYTHSLTHSTSTAKPGATELWYTGICRYDIRT